MRAITRRERSAAALLFVLASVAVLASIASAIHTSSLGDWRLARREIDRVRTEAGAVSGLRLVEALIAKDRRPYFWLPDPSNPEPVRADGTVFVMSEIEEAWAEIARTREEPMELDGVELVFDVVDEASFLNVNRAPGLHLAHMVEARDMLRPEEERQIDPANRVEALRDLTNAVEDWRDADSAPLPGGAESDYYQGLAGGGYQARNGFMHSPEELRLVKGFGGRLLFEGSAPMVTGRTSLFERAAARARSAVPQGPRRMIDLLTVHGLRAQVNVNTVLPEVLRVLPGFHRNDKAEAMIARLLENRPYMNRSEVNSTLAAVDAAGAQQAQTFLDVRSDFLRVGVRARVPGTATLELRAVVRRLPNGQTITVSFRER